MAQRSSGRSARLRVLIATDGSPSARAAIATALAFPWPRTSRVRGVVVSSSDWVRSPSPQVRRAFAPAFVRVADTTRRSLARRWPDAEVVNVEGRPADGILREARRFGADVIVVGWRGYGAFRRILVGSVSRTVVEQARRAVLVVRRPVREVRRIVIGVDGSPNARRAVDLAARLPQEQREIVVVRVVEPRTVPTAGRLPAALRSIVLTALAAVNEQLMRAARRDADATVARLERAGWKARAEVRSGHRSSGCSTPPSTATRICSSSVRARRAASSARSSAASRPARSIAHRCRCSSCGDARDRGAGRADAGTQRARPARRERRSASTPTPHPGQRVRGAPDGDRRDV